MERRGKSAKTVFCADEQSVLASGSVQLRAVRARMVYTAAIAGLTVQGLINNAQSIAQLRYVPA